MDINSIRNVAHHIGILKSKNEKYIPKNMDEYRMILSKVFLTETDVYSTTGNKKSEIRDRYNYLEFFYNGCAYFIDNDTLKEDIREGVLSHLICETGDAES